MFTWEEVSNVSLVWYSSIFSLKIWRMGLNVQLANLQLGRVGDILKDRIRVQNNLAELE